MFQTRFAGRARLPRPLPHPLQEPARWRPRASVAAAALTLAACGGGNGGSADTASTPSTAINVQALSVPVSKPVRTTNAVADLPVSRDEAARFLMQATFGPTEAEINRLMVMGYGAWIDDQFSQPSTSHRATWEATDAALKLETPPSAGGQDQVWESFWKQAVNGPDQLRQRVAFALSQIFVISAVDGNVGDQPRALAAWLDMLGSTGLTTYRDLLETVSLHPLMGLYLTSLRNQKADSTGRVPDENYAREVMQLFSIGLVKLNPDGTPVLDTSGKPIETYTPSDISGLAKVFTGFSWTCGAVTSTCFSSGATGGANSVSDPDRYFKPMMAYPAFHSTESKSFLGVTIGTQRVANPLASLKVALDTLATHPNTPPFISRQLIQRLVTSNPSPAYVQAVASVFVNNGAGVRGDMKAVVKAILTHAEARQQSNSAGKVKEPVLRLTAFLRAFPHRSETARWRVGNTDNASTSLGQTPLRAGSVFNFWRPGYVAPGSQSAAAGLVAPELQLLNESTASGFVNFMRSGLTGGFGQFILAFGGVTYNHNDLQRDWTAEMQVAKVPADLATLVTSRLLYGQANAALKTEITNAVATITVPALNAGGTNQSAIDAALRNRINTAVLLTLAAPEFLVQK